MQYCNECQSVEQGTITFYPEGYTVEQYVLMGLKEMERINAIKISRGEEKIDMTLDELIEWGKDETAIEICSQCESQDETMVNVDEDYGQDR